MYKGKSVLCTICARGGSKGVPGKNTRLLLGKPMIVWTIETAYETGIFEHVVISTDSDQIAEISEKAGAEVFFRRSKGMASDTAAKLPVIQDAFLRSEKHYDKTFDVSIDLDATSPLRFPADIVASLDLFLESAWENLITGMPARRSPYFNLVEDVGNGRVVISKHTGKTLTRRQDAPSCYDMNASIYIWWRESLLASTEVLGPSTGIYIMPEERSIDIDSETDFLFVEYLLRKRQAVL